MYAAQLPAGELPYLFPVSQSYVHLVCQNNSLEQWHSNCVSRDPRVSRVFTAILLQDYPMYQLVYNQQAMPHPTKPQDLHPHPQAQ
jgi:hypothetical protein